MLKENDQIVKQSADDLLQMFYEQIDLMKNLNHWQRRIVALEKFPIESIELHKQTSISINAESLQTALISLLQEMRDIKTLIELLFNNWKQRVATKIYDKEDVFRDEIIFQAKEISKADIISKLVLNSLNEWKKYSDHFFETNFI